MQIAEQTVRIVDVIKLLRLFESNSDTKLLRNEAVLLELIKSEPGMPVKYYMNRSDMSYSGFYKVVSSLIKAGLVDEVSDVQDRRQKLLS